MAEMSTAPLAEIEIGLSVEQAQQVVDGIAILWRAANRDGKKKVRMLNVLSNTLIRELTAMREGQVTI
jgi:hypothetical protein